MSEDQDHDAFLERFLPVQTALRGYLLAVTRDPAATDDLFQEVAMVLWRKFREFDRTRNFAAWATGITKLQILRHRQALARSRLVFSEDAVARLAEMACAEAEAEDARRAYLSACLGKLPSNHKTVVDLRFERKKSLAEIAAHIRKSVAAVEMMMVRIRRALCDCVEKSMAVEKAGTS